LANVAEWPSLASPDPLTCDIHVLYIWYIYIYTYI